MVGLKKWKVVRDALRYVCKEGRRTGWWLCDESLVDLCGRIEASAWEAGEDNRPDDVEIINRTDRNVLFRIRDDGGGRSFVCKVFFLNHLSHRLRYFNYGLDEAANLIEAKRRGIESPDVYGYGQVRGRGGVVRRNMVILEDLGGCSTMGALMEGASGDRRIELFNMTIPLFESLYRAKCNHIDLNCNAIMLDAEKANPELYLLDFQHAQFRDNSSNEVLMFEAGFFGRSCQKWVSEEEIYNWLKRILGRVGVDDSDQQEILRERFDYYFRSKGLSPTQSTLSRKQRKAIR